jgi:hypothetical protein
MADLLLLLLLLLLLVPPPGDGQCAAAHEAGCTRPADGVQGSLQCCQRT